MSLRFAMGQSISTLRLMYGSTLPAVSREQHDRKLEKPVLRKKEDQGNELDA
jgi:hypothetical protein